MITIREATELDVPAIGQLFRDTILAINRKDYSEEQVEVWASGYDDEEKWIKRIENQYFILAFIDEALSGFASIAPTGYIDYMFVHKDFQARGVAKMLLVSLLEKATVWQLKRLTSNVSITALPFFKRKGFKVVRVQKVLYKKVYFTNNHVEYFL